MPLSAPAQPIASPSWLDRLTAFIDRLPISPWALYSMTFVVLALANRLPIWIDGSHPWGPIDVQHVLIAAWCVFLSLIAGREVLQKTPTWPWQPGAPAAVITALLLPVGLYLIQRPLERIFDL